MRIYKVYKQGNKRCTKTFTNLDEALSYIYVHEDYYHIEYFDEYDGFVRRIYK